MSSESRLLSLLARLGTGRSFTATDLAAEFGVTERTIRRDIATLRELGYTVDAAPGVDGGYRAGSRTVLPPLQLESGEAFATALGLSLLAGAGLGSADTASASGKLEAMLPTTAASAVREIGTAVTVAPGNEPDVDHAAVGAIASAIAARRRITFAYAKPWTDAAPAVRRVEPAQLVVLGSHWYLYGWDLDRSDWRVFRLDRLSEVHVTTFGFPLRPAPDAEAAVRRAVTVAAYEHTIVLDLEATPAEIEPWFSTRAATIAEVSGGVRVTFGVPDLGAAAIYTATIPFPCRVVDPPEFVAELSVMRGRIGAIMAASDTEVSGK